MSEEQQKARITSITIENFKGIGAPITIPLKPITLMFGANSAGKSSVLQAVAMIRSMLEKGLDKALPLECSGHHFALGEFRDFVHMHDTDRTISFEIECLVDSQILPMSILQQTSADIAPKKLKLKLIWGQKWYSQRYEISYDDCMFCQGKYHVGWPSWFLDSDLWYRHPLVESVLNQQDIDVNALTDEDTDDLDGYFTFTLAPDSTSESDRDGNRLAEEWELLVPSDRLEKLGGDCWELEAFLDQTARGALKLVYDEVSRLRFIGPLREIPESLDDLSGISSNDWYTGIVAWLYAGDYYRFDDFNVENTSRSEKINQDWEWLNRYMAKLEMMPYEFKSKGKMCIDLSSEIYRETKGDFLKDERSDEERNKLLLDYLAKTGRLT